MKEGEDLLIRTQIENLFMVGDVNKSAAHIMTEGVAHGAKKVFDTICDSKNNKKMDDINDRKRI